MRRWLKNRCGLASLEATRGARYGNRSERDLRHSVNTQAAYRAALRLASLPEDAMDLSTKLKITAVMAAVLVAVVWAVPVPV